MVKSSTIVAKRERPEVLSPELKSKVETLRRLLEEVDREASGP